MYKEKIIIGFTLGNRSDLSFFFWNCWNIRFSFSVKNSLGISFCKKWRSWEGFDVPYLLLSFLACSKKIFSLKIYVSCQITRFVDIFSLFIFFDRDTFSMLLQSMWISHLLLPSFKDWLWIRKQYQHLSQDNLKTTLA